MVFNVSASTTQATLTTLKSSTTTGGVSSVPALIWLDSVTSYFFNVPFPVLFAAFFGAMVMLARQQPVTKTKMTSFIFGTVSVIASAGAAAFITPLVALKYELAANTWLALAFIGGVAAQAIAPNLAGISQALVHSSGDIGKTFVEALKRRIDNIVGGKKDGS